MGIVAPKGPGPLSREHIALTTEYNEIKPPKNVNIHIDGDSQEMSISWEHNCPFAKTFPDYIINITELTYNKSAIVELKGSENKVMMHKFKSIEDGSVFDVTLSTNSKDAEPYVKRIYAPKLHSPRQLKVWPEKNGTYVVYWKEVEGNDHNQK